jgi:dephospho-CoA kinase
MKNKFVVYTALFGDYDNLIDPNENYEGCDFICFTDQINLKSDIWEIRIVENIDLPLNMMNRRYKILPHLFLSEYEWSMYVDANILIRNNPFELANKYLSRYNFTMPKHFARDCVYNEAKECVILGKSKHDETKKQIDDYKKQSFPENYGLGENNILFRKHNSEKVIKIMKDWWEELNTQTKRDQLSLAYILWKNKEIFNYMEESARVGLGYFEYILHNESKNKTFFQKLKEKMTIIIKRIIY